MKLSFCPLLSTLAPTILNRGAILVPKIASPKPLVRAFPLRPSGVLHEVAADGAVAPGSKDIVVSRAVILHVQHVGHDAALVFPAPAASLQLRVAANFAQPAHPRQLEGRVAVEIEPGQGILHARRNNLAERVWRELRVLQLGYVAAVVELAGLNFFSRVSVVCLCGYLERERERNREGVGAAQDDSL